MMKTFKVLSLLLMYPESDWLAALPDMHAALVEEAPTNANAASRLAPLFDLLKNTRLIALQENYVATFDRNPSHSLHLFEHIHGESRDRGSAMINLLEEYWKHGFDAAASELPDYVPLFLEFLSQLPSEEALPLLGDAVHVLALIGRKLDKNGSPYAAAFQLLEALSPVAAPGPARAPRGGTRKASGNPSPALSQRGEALSRMGARKPREPPVRDMDEAMEMFGPTADGAEPLLNPRPQIAVVRMPVSRRQGAATH